MRDAFGCAIDLLAEAFVRWGLDGRYNEVGRFVFRPGAWRVVPIVTLSVTHRADESRTDRASREFWLDFRRGGMAEWSMAVVLKTTEPETVPAFESLSLRQIELGDNLARCDF